MFYYENIITRSLDINKLWDLYSNVHDWSQWDKALKEVELKGAFQTGTEGILYSNDMPPLPFQLDAVKKHVSFAVVSCFGTIKVHFGHEIIHRGKDEYSLKHSVTMEGAPEEQLNQIGQEITSGIPQSMETLIALAKIES